MIFVNVGFVGIGRGKSKVMLYFLKIGIQFHLVTLCCGNIMPRFHAFYHEARQKNTIHLDPLDAGEVEFLAGFR